MSQKINGTFIDIKDFREFLDKWHPTQKIFATSGGFDPVHVGHLRCFNEMRDIAYEQYRNPITVAIVNGDGFLERKKGFAFMSEKERLEIISGFRSIDYAVLWNDSSQTVCGALEIIKPDFFCKGGDRDSFNNVPESKVCADIGCQVLFNVGGGKVQSSSSLVDRMENFGKRTIDI
tara:strand:- start:2027 stop:2554 length:528 start_codon:yes stop_codon:yes gene_type:complete